MFGNIIIIIVITTTPAALSGACVCFRGGSRKPGSTFCLAVTATLTHTLHTLYQLEAPGGHELSLMESRRGLLRPRSW